MGRTYFTGVLPIALDDLSSGFNVGTVVNLSPELLGMVGFTQDQVERYVDEIYADRGFDRANYQDVLADLKAFYDGYRFLPGAEPLYNATITNWYLRCLVVNSGKIPEMPLDANVRTDVGWIRRLAGGGANALARVRAYVERGEGEAASRSGLAAKFGRIKFDFEAAFPYYLYFLGYLTFNLTVAVEAAKRRLRPLLAGVWAWRCFHHLGEIRFRHTREMSSVLYFQRPRRKEERTTWRSIPQNGPQVRGRSRRSEATTP